MTPVEVIVEADRTEKAVVVAVLRVVMAIQLAVERWRGLGLVRWWCYTALVHAWGTSLACVERG